MRLIGDILKNLFRKPFTRRYPHVKPPIPKDFRGRIIHDKNKCIYCGLCAKFCPSKAITVDVKNKKWEVDIGKCLFCGQCVEVCHEMPKKDAITLSKEYELSDTNKSKFILK